ncbi:hypothetical protein BaRGS_00000402, partial [Batillaria attramentaria]
LYKQIPCDSPSADRLSQLVRLGLRQTLDQLEKEMGEVAGFELFSTEALKSVEGVINSMETDGTFSAACENPGTVPNPVNIQMEATIAELNSSIHRLEREDRDWDALLQQLEQQAQDAEKQLSQLEIDSSELPSDVQELAQSYLTGLPDMADTITDVCTNVKTTSLLMDQYRHTVGLLKQASQSLQYHYANAANTLNTNTHNIVNSPRTIIKRMVSIEK